MIPKPQLWEVALIDPKKAIMGNSSFNQPVLNKSICVKSQKFAKVSCPVHEYPALGWSFHGFQRERCFCEVKRRQRDIYIVGKCINLSLLIHVGKMIEICHRINRLEKTDFSKDIVAIGQIKICAWQVYTVCIKIKISFRCKK